MSELNDKIKAQVKAIKIPYDQWEVQYNTIWCRTLELADSKFIKVKVFDITFSPNKPHGRILIFYKDTHTGMVRFKEKFFFVQEYHIC